MPRWRGGSFPKLPIWIKSRGKSLFGQDIMFSCDVSLATVTDYDYRFIPQILYPINDN
ncbi:MAG: hypothetical protein OIN87_00285 [Candidatus Methanoperedens sp.]|nr:hypothetical protein [Candidatus Methanoperedens sp.]